MISEVIFNLMTEQNFEQMSSRDFGWLLITL